MFSLLIVLYEIKVAMDHQLSPPGDGDETPKSILSPHVFQSSHIVSSRIVSGTTLATYNMRYRIIQYVFVRFRVEPEFESEKRSNSELIVSVPECPFHEATYVSCDDSPLRPLISLKHVIL